MHTLSFREEYDYTAEWQHGISVPITLGQGEWEAPVIPRLDTGAENCIFNRVHGEALHLDIEHGERKVFHTPTGAEIVTFGHRVTIESLDYRVDSMVYFAQDEAFKRDVLGRIGWIDQFRLGIIHYDSRLYLSGYNDT